jgi:hypothetical protein
MQTLMDMCLARMSREQFDEFPVHIREKWFRHAERKFIDMVVKGEVLLRIPGLVPFTEERTEFSTPGCFVTSYAHGDNAHIYIFDNYDEIDDHIMYERMNDDLEEELAKKWQCEGSQIFFGYGDWLAGDILRMLHKGHTNIAISASPSYPRDCIPTPEDLISSIFSTIRILIREDNGFVSKIFQGLDRRSVCLSKRTALVPS